jgi:crotonobetaine/carnitine-CoA ligase
VSLTAITDATTGMTLHHALLQHADRDPGRTFLDSAGHGAPPATYGELEALVSGAAASLRQLGIRPGDRVAVLMGRSLQYVAAALAVQRIGAIYVPCSPLFSDLVLRHVLALTGAAWLIADEASAGQLDRAGIGTNGPLQIIGPAWLGQPAATPADIFVPAARQLPPPADPDSVAMVSFTSGTTALPKGVIFTHGNWLHCAVNMTSGLQWGRDERVLHQLPLHPANGGLVVLAPSLLHGSAIVLAPGFEAASFAETLAAERISLAFVSGREVGELLGQPPSPAERQHPCQRLAQRLELSPGHRRRFEQRYGVTLISQYGCSETLGPVVFGSGSLPVTEGSVGRAVPGYQVAVTVAAGTTPGSDDCEGSDSGDGEIGEFTVRSLSRHGLTAGYWGDDAATSGMLHDGWLRTGDAVQIDSHGCVHYLGRLNDASGQAAQVLAARRAERIIREVDGVREAVAMAGPGGGLAVFVVADERTGDALEETGRVAGAVRVIRVHAIPRDILGKVSRPELRAMLETAGDDRRDH